jgi:hypothetical protein
VGAVSCRSEGFLLDVYSMPRPSTKCRWRSIACDELGLVKSIHDPATSLLADKIIEVAQRGVHDPDLLRRTALNELGTGAALAHDDADCVFANFATKMVRQPRDIRRDPPHPHRASMPRLYNAPRKSRAVAKSAKHHRHWVWSFLVIQRPCRG